MPQGGHERGESITFQQDVVRIPGANEVVAQEIIMRGEGQTALLAWQLEHTNISPTAVLQTIQQILEHTTLSVPTLQKLEALCLPYVGTWPNGDFVMMLVKDRLEVGH